MGWIVYVPGILMILFGLAIIVMPEILVALIAAFFIISGISLLGVARTMSGKFGGGKDIYRSGF